MGTTGDEPVGMPDTDLNGRILTAIRDLPLEWQQILWYADVQGEHPQRIGTLLGIQPERVSSMLGEARSALRNSYRQQQVQDTPTEDTRSIRGPKYADVMIRATGSQYFVRAKGSMPLIKRFPADAV